METVRFCLFIKGLNSFRVVARQERKIKQAGMWHATQDARLVLKKVFVMIPRPLVRLVLSDCSVFDVAVQEISKEPLLYN